MKRRKGLPEGHGQVSWPEVLVHRHGGPSQTIGLKRLPGQEQCLVRLRASRQGLLLVYHEAVVGAD